MTASPATGMDQMIYRRKLWGGRHPALKPDRGRKLVPGGHIGLFMGARTLAEAWPEIGRWIAAQPG